MFQSQEEEYLELLIEQEQESQELKRQSQKEEELQGKREKVKNKEALLDDLVRKGHAH